MPPSLGTTTVAFSRDLPEPFPPSPMPYSPRVSLVYAWELVDWGFLNHAKVSAGAVMLHETQEAPRGAREGFRFPAESHSRESESRVGCGKLRLSQASPGCPRGPDLGDCLLAEMQWASLVPAPPFCGECPLEPSKADSAPLSEDAVIQGPQKTSNESSHIERQLPPS